MFAAFSSLGSNQKMKIVAFVDHNIILAWYGRARRTSGQAMPARRFPPFPQFCLKISTFAGIIVQAELTNQCEAYLCHCVGRQNPSWMEVDTMRKLLTALVAAAS